MLPAKKTENSTELLGTVVRESNESVESRMQSGIGMNEGIHLIGIAGHDNDEAVASVLHPFQESVDGLLAKISLLVGERVGFVNEKNPVEGASNDPIGCDSGLTDIFGDESRAVTLHEVAFLEDAEGLVDASHQSSYGGLARAGFAGVDGVIAGADWFQSAGDSSLLEPGKVCRLPDLIFNDCLLYTSPSPRDRG